MDTWFKTNCNMCAQSCGLEVMVKKNQIISVRPDPDNPNSSNYCCRKGRAIKYYQHNSDRLNYPLKRMGNDFVRISWEQAYTEIAEKLNGLLANHGPRCLASIGGALASSRADGGYLRALMNARGAQYHYSPVGLEFMGLFWAHSQVIGKGIPTTNADDEHTEALIVWGSNTYVSHQMSKARREIRNISEDPNRLLVVVDPRLSETARMADMHIPLRPSTDSLLLRTIIALILSEGWENRAFIDANVADFDKVRHWYAGVDIKESCRVCGVSVEKVREFCKILSTRKWALHQDLGIFMSRHNTLNSFLLLHLGAITGTLLMPGGTIVKGGYGPPRAFTDEDDPAVWRTIITNRFAVFGNYPTAVLSNEILNDHPDRLRGAVITMSNPLRSFPDSNNLEKAFDALDLVVCLDICMTETARKSHYVLPVRSPYEAFDWAPSPSPQGYPEVYAQLKYPVLLPEGERKEGAEILLNIADRMGSIPEIPQSLYEAARTKTRKEYYTELMTFIEANSKYRPYLLFIVGKTLGTVMRSVAKSGFWMSMMVSGPRTKQAAIRKGFPDTDLVMDDVFQAVVDHPEGTIIGLVDVNKGLEVIRHEDKKFHLYHEKIDEYIKRITPEQEERELQPSAEFPLLLSSGSHADAGSNGVMRNPDSYRYRKPWTVKINPLDCAELDISDGQKVRITTKGGIVEVEAEYDFKAGRGYAQLPHHFGFEFDGVVHGVGASRVSSRDELEELTGNPIWRRVPCSIEPIHAEEAKK